MRRHYLLLIFGFLLSLQAIKAQNALRLSLFNPSQIPANISIGDTFSFDVWVHNDSTIAYNDTVDFTCQIIHGDTFTQTTPNITSGFYWDRIPIPIPALDSVTFSITANVTPPAFKAGPSVVIIWPRALGVQGTGTSHNIGTVLSINEASNDKLKFDIEQNTLFIYKQPEIVLNQLRLYDISGRLLFTKDNPEQNSPLPLYYHGTYIVEVVYNQSKRKVFRFNY